MKKLLFSIIFLLLIAPASAYSDIAPARVSAYIIFPPEVSVNLKRNIDTLNCTWKVKDLDPDEKLTASIQWFKNSNHIEELDKVMLIETAAEYKETSPVIEPGEKWECKVLVTDKFGAKGESSSAYTSPSGITGFFIFNQEKIIKELDKKKDEIAKQIKQALTNIANQAIAKISEAVRNFNFKALLNHAKNQ